AEKVPVLLLTGPRAVGKSTVGYEVFSRLIRAGTRTAYVDLDQIGFCRPPPADDPENHRLKVANLGALWPGFRAAGARGLVVTGRVELAEEVRGYVDAVPGADLTLLRLRAGRAALTERILDRGRGGGAPIPGDELRGQPTEDLLRLADRVA